MRKARKGLLQWGKSQGVFSCARMYEKEWHKNEVERRRAIYELLKVWKRGEKTKEIERTYVYTPKTGNGPHDGEKSISHGGRTD